MRRAVLGPDPLAPRPRRSGRCAPRPRMRDPAGVVGEHPVGVEHLGGRADQPASGPPASRRSAAAARRRPCRGARSSAAASSESSCEGATGGSCSTADADGQAVAELGALQPLGQVRRDARRASARPRPISSPRGHHLGQHHGDDLQVLDLVLGVDCARCGSGRPARRRRGRRAAAARRGSAW